MTSNVTTFSAFQACIHSIRERFTAVSGGSEASDDTLEETRNRREFIQEMLNRNPDAFKGEVDVQNMMHMYPGRF